MELVKAGMDNGQLAKKVERLGIDFDLTDDYINSLRKMGAQEILIQALRAARPQPLSKEQVLQLVAGGVLSQRAAALVIQHGIDFGADEEYLNTLRVAGADDSLIAAVREASDVVTADLVVATSPQAVIYLDGEFHGYANAQGELRIKARLGAHALKVSLAGKKDFQQSFTLASTQAVTLKVQLLDEPGSIRLQTIPGASITLDGANRGSTGANGEMVVGGVSSGLHELRVSAPEKSDLIQSVVVTPGQETRVEAALQEVPPPPAPVGANPEEVPKVGSQNVIVHPATTAFQATYMKGALSFSSGMLTVGDGTVRFQSNNGRDSLLLPMADIDEAFETRGDLGARHDVHVRLKNKKVYIFMSDQSAGHGPEGIQFARQVIYLINQSTGRSGNNR